MTLPSEVVRDFFRKIEKYAATAGLFSAIAGAAISVLAKSFGSWLTRSDRHVQVSSGNKIEVSALASSEAAEIAKALEKRTIEAHLGDCATDPKRWTRDSALPSLVARDHPILIMEELPTIRPEKRRLGRIGLRDGFCSTAGPGGRVGGARAPEPPSANSSSTFLRYRLG
jgi:hypothetical protein